MARKKKTIGEFTTGRKKKTKSVFSSRETADETITKMLDTVLKFYSESGDDYRKKLDDLETKISTEEDSKKLQLFYSQRKIYLAERRHVVRDLGDLALKIMKAKSLGSSMDDENADFAGPSITFTELETVEDNGFEDSENEISEM